MVIITARKAEGPQGINQAVEKLNQLPGIKGKAVGLPGNVANLEDTQRLLDEVKKITSELHILIANAGATWGGPFEPTPDWSSQKILDLNVRGVFNLARLCVRFSLCSVLTNSVLRLSCQHPRRLSIRLVSLSSLLLPVLMFLTQVTTERSCTPSQKQLHITLHETSR